MQEDLRSGSTHDEHLKSVLSQKNRLETSDYITCADKQWKRWTSYTKYVFFQER